MATLLAGVSFSVVGGVQLVATSQAFTDLAKSQSFTITRQLASVAPGSERTLAGAIPYSPEGLDGLAMFNGAGRELGAGGGLAPTLPSLAPLAVRAIDSGRTIQLFRSRDGRLFQKLRPWSDPHSLGITVQPYSDGAVVTAFHVDWATARLRRAALRTALGFAGGALFICLGLLLMLGRLVTWPLGRLAGEVRHLGEGNLVMHLSRQHSPELEQLASDISKMRDDLTEAMRRSTTDPLTGIANHRAFHEQLEAAVGAASANGRPLALIAVDLDNLKTINDSHGHLAGDRVLASVAAAIAGACRDGDLCARVGGDEFFVLCPGVTAAAAASIADRILGAVQDASPEIARGALDGLEVSVSVGVCDTDGARGKDDLVHGADAALYQAKAKGRNRVDVFDPVCTDLPDLGGSRPAHPGERLAATAQALALAVDAKDSGARSHCETVSRLAAAVAERIGFDAAMIEKIARAGLLHDVGKIGTPDAILCKPGPLTPDERLVMQEHPVLGARIMLSAGLPADEADWVLHHHERIDATGYPDGLAADDVPLPSRIILVADAFEAMTSDRVYRAAGTPEDAIAELWRGAGTQFDPGVVDLFVEIMDSGRRSGAKAGLQ